MPTPQDPETKAYAPQDFEFKYKKDYQNDWQIHQSYIQDFDSYEAMLSGEVYDSVSKTSDRSKITDSYTTTLARERADRVMAKLPEGATEAIGKADVGKAAFMDILRQKWIYPNANAQHPFQEKLNMWQFYSSVYGYMPMFYDWNVSPSGYSGPDCWLWSPRNLVPQAGKVSISDMEYVTALTWVSKAKLEEILEDLDSGDDDDRTEAGGWDREALLTLIAVADRLADADANKDSKVQRTRTPSGTRLGVCLATRYEAGEDGEWCVFAPDHGYIEVRRLKNPHKNGRIPFVIKYSQPLFDSFYGIGDFQRAKPLQFARDGLTNFYFRGIKMNLIPPIVANANGVVKHTLDYREGAVMLETIPNAIRRLETSNAGLSTYQAAQSALTGSLLSLFGSQNASMPGADTLNPSQGKTPQAINLYSDKEATRDGADRRHLETAIEQLTDGFNSLVVNVGADDVPVNLFEQDIADIIKSGYADVKELFDNMDVNKSKTAATLRIDVSKLKGVEYRFNINPNSTALANTQAQVAAIKDLMDTLGRYQNVIQDDPTVTINWGKILSVYEELSGIKGASEFVIYDPNAQKQPEPQAPSPTAVTTPGGQVHEVADLAKLYDTAAKVGDHGLMAQIVQALGFNPSPPGPTSTSTGHTFNDPHFAGAAEAIINASQPLPPIEQPATMGATK